MSGDLHQFSVHRELYEGVTPQLFLCDCKGTGVHHHISPFHSPISTKRKAVSAKAYAPGAFSLVSSYASGLGSAIGIGLGITVTVTLIPTNCRERRLRVISQHPSAKGGKLIQECFDGLSSLCGLLQSFIAIVTITSTLPIARGLKSSSALANAIVLAAARALGLEISLPVVMTIARSAELAAACSTFGSVDDGWATLLGGVVFAETTSRRLIARDEIASDLDVIVMAPPEAHRHVPAGAREAMGELKAEFTSLHDRALTGDHFRAMTHSGIVHAQRFGYDATVIIEAIKNGAEGATLSGKGPAFVAITRRPHTFKVVTAWKKRGHEILVTRVDNTGATVLKT